MLNTVQQNVRHVFDVITSLTRSLINGTDLVIINISNITCNISHLVTLLVMKMAEPPRDLFFLQKLGATEYSGKLAIIRL